MKKVVLPLLLLGLVSSMLAGCSCAFGKTSEESDNNKKSVNSTSNETDAKKIMQPQEWVNAYIDYINTNYNDGDNGTDYRTYALVYVDTDNIPEILYYIDSAVGFITYADGKVNEESFLRGDLKYLPGEGLLYGYNGMRDNDSHQVCEIKDGHFSEVVNAKSDLNESTKLFDNYTLNGNPASQDDVGKALAQAFGNCNYRIKNGRIIIENDRAKTMSDEQTYTHDELINALNGKK